MTISCNLHLENIGDKRQAENLMKSAGFEITEILSHRGYWDHSKVTMPGSGEVVGFIFSTKTNQPVYAILKLNLIPASIFRAGVVEFFCYYKAAQPN